jgi:hypothetical protein
MDAATCLGVRSLYPARLSGQLQIQYKKTFTTLSGMMLEKVRTQFCSSDLS